MAQKCDDRNERRNVCSELKYRRQEGRLFGRMGAERGKVPSAMHGHEQPNIAADPAQHVERRSH